MFASCSAIGSAAFGAGAGALGFFNEGVFANVGVAAGAAGFANEGVAAGAAGFARAGVTVCVAWGAALA